MVRFHDKDGVGFGQISFFNQPPMSAELLDTGYVDGLMTIAPPSLDRGRKGANLIRASWLLWAQEDGIAPLRFPVDFERKQPAAKRIEWQPGMGKIQFDLGGGRPAAILLHETDQGYFRQNLIDGGLQGRQQRAAWLDAERQFDRLAQLAAAVAIAALLAHLIARWRRRRPS
jgi:hypothetical protein